MSASTIEYYTSISQQVTIYLGIPILTFGLIGDIFNLIVFLSLKTFRDNSCAFCLTVMSSVDIGQLITGLFSRIMISGFGIDWTLSSTFYCKFRAYCFQFCALTSFVCMSLAAINQCLATCSNPRWRRWSNIKIAHRVIIVVMFIWLVHGIPYWIYFNHVQSEVPGNITCISSNEIFEQYHINVVTLVFSGFLPISINGVFGYLAYHNIQQFDRRALPYVQRELDNQLTAIILIQFIYHTIVTIPYLILTILQQDIMLTNDPVEAARLQFFTNLTLCIYYLNYAVS